MSEGGKIGSRVIEGLDPKLFLYIGEHEDGRLMGSEKSFMNFIDLHIPILYVPPNCFPFLGNSLFTASNMFPRN